MLLSPLVVLLAFHLIIQLYNSESTTNSLLAIGTLQGVLLIIDPSTILLLPFFLWALSYFLLLDFRKMLLVIYFMVLTAFIGYGTLYVLGLYDPEGLQIGIIWDQIEAFAADRVVASLYIAYLVLALLFILFRNRFLQMRSVKIRNVHRIFSLSIPFFLLLYLFSRQIDWNYTALLAIPFTAVFSYYFENAQKKWIYEGLFVVLMFVHFFTYGYIIHN